MINQNNTDSSPQPDSPYPDSPYPDSLIDDLARALDAVDALIVQVRPDQWSAPTPCPDWNVRALVDHVIGMNRVFAALLAGQTPPPRPAPDHVDRDPVGAYRQTASTLLSACAVPGVLEREYRGPLGTATGAERLQIRLYDLLAHGWDLARATGQGVELPTDVVEQSLAFARTQIREPSRPGRFGPAQAIDPHASSIERLVAFLGRPIGAAQ